MIRFRDAAIAVLVSGVACSNANSGATAGGTDGGASGGSVGGDLGASDPGPGGVRFVASGEVLALTGYAFPPVNPDDASFVDGWDVQFTRLLTTIDKVTLAENPDFMPGDQSKVGSIVAQLDGPWAVDLAHSDPSYLPGKGGPGEQAVPFASLGEGLLTDGSRYAFGFDVIAATASAKMVNVTGDAVTDYQEMVTNGCAVSYAGTARFKGNKADPTCYPDDRKTWPDVVNFRFCFKSPTSYVNCQNPDNDPAKGFAGEEHQRGLALKADASVIAQVTIHTDHPFWDSVLHDSPAHFDQFAARVVGQPGVPMVTLESTKGVDYTAYTDVTGKPLSWRYCVQPPTDVHAKFTGPMSFDPQTVPHATGAGPATGLRDYYDFATYDQSTQGHLNSDGLCFVRRSYPSPQ